MAEKKQRKIADPIEFNEDDPFAELTRIMGFDPRVSALGQARESARAEPAAVVTPLAPRAFVQPAPPRAPEPQVAHDDFGIDLEKELLGEFADFEAPHETGASVPDEAEPVAAQIAPTPPVDTVDLVIGDEFEDAFAEALDEEAYAASSEAEPVAEVAEEVQPVAEEVRPVAEEVQPVAEEARPIADFERPVGIETIDQPMAAQTTEIAEFADDDFMPEFDLDEFELDESSLVETPAEPPAAPTETVAVEPSVPVTAYDALAEVDMDFSAALDSELEADAEGDEQVPPSSDPETVAGREKLVLGTDVATTEDELEIHLENELGALLDDDHAQSEAEKPMVAEPIAAAPTPGHVQFPSDSRWANLEADEEAAEAPSGSQATSMPSWSAQPDTAAADYRRPFSDPALIARHANFQKPPAPAAQPAEDLDDLLNAMESEVHGENLAPAPVEAELETPYAQPEARYATSQSRYEKSDAHDPWTSIEEEIPVQNAVTGYAYDDAADYDDAVPALASYEEDQQGAPEVETIDVPETAIAVTDDLDIPELDYEEDAPQAQAYDDLDADLVAGFNEFKETAVSEEPVNQTVRGVPQPSERMDFDADFESLYGPAYAGQATTAHPNIQPEASGYRYDLQSQDYEDFDEAGQSATPTRDRFVDLDFDNSVEEEIPLTFPASERAAAPRRGLLIAAVVGGVALLGGVGALALSFGGGDASNSPVVVKADDSPIKVKPENPGGTTVPNQDNKVYDAVKGATAAPPPAQEKLVTTSEEPIDMATAVSPNDALPGISTGDDIIPKAEDRVDPVTDADQGLAEAESIVVAPRKVKTMVVRSDGTLVAREDPTPEETTAMADATPPQPASPALAPANNDETGAVAKSEEPTFQSPGAEPVPVKPVKTRTLAPADQTEALPATSETAPTPEVSALPPAKPVEEPAAQTAETKPVEEKTEEVATATIEPTTVATSAWSVQIASQPSADSAKSTYQDLAKRYGEVIGGRGVNIIKAEITGKGTYWRVRVPAKSRNDAIDLCTNYKAAGGNCFVSK